MSKFIKVFIVIAFIGSLILSLANKIAERRMILEFKHKAGGNEFYKAEAHKEQEDEP